MPLSVDECKDYLQKAFTDEELKPFFSAIAQSDSSSPLGCGAKLEIQCRKCERSGPEGIARAFLQAPPVGIVLCANRVDSYNDVKDCLKHELTHAYDMCAQKLDLFRCLELGYSEVRAARNVECNWYNKTPIFNYNWPFFEKLKSACIQRKATRATEALFPTEGKGCVAAVFFEAVKDMAPLDGGVKPRSAALESLLEGDEKSKPNSKPNCHSHHLDQHHDHLNQDT